MKSFPVMPCLLLLGWTIQTNAQSGNEEVSWVLGPQAKGDCNEICASKDENCSESLGRQAASDGGKIKFDGINCKGRNYWDYGQGFSQCTDPTCCDGYDGSCQYHCSLPRWPGCKIDDGFAFSDHSRICPCTGWTDQDLEHINTTVQSFMTEHNVVGSSLALVKDGRLVYAKGFGVMDKDTREAVQSTSLFRIASLSKPITSAAIMMLSERIPNLMERKVFGLGGILGTTYGTLPYSEYETLITIKHLLEHTAGGEAWRNSGRDPMFDRQHLTDDHDELVGWVLDTRDPSKKPGTGYAYSNFGYSVLGRVIEKLSGKSYESFVRDNILNPIGALGMKIGKSKKSDIYPNEVTYHSSSSAYYPDLNIERMDAHGGWISSAADYAQFLMHFDGSVTKQDLISRSTYDLMTEGSSVNPSYAKGWSVNPRHDNIWHSGSLPGTRAFAVNVAKRQWGSFETSAVFVMNSENGGDKIDPLLWKIQKGIKNWP